MLRKIVETFLLRIYDYEGDIPAILGRLERMYGSKTVGLKAAIREWGARHGTVPNTEQTQRHDTGDDK